MKITKTQLKKIIKEELKRTLLELEGMPSGEEYSAGFDTFPPEYGGGAILSAEEEDYRMIEMILSEFEPQFRTIKVDPREVENALSLLEPDGAVVELVNSAVEEVQASGARPNIRDQRTSRDRIAELIVTKLGLYS